MSTPPFPPSTTNTNTLPVPPLDPSTRLALLTDTPRIALVAFSSHATERFQSYLKPNFSLYPTDTLASYRVGYGRAILDPGKVVIVAEDFLDEAEDEDGGTHPLVREIAAREREGKEREKVVVAACLVRFSEGSRWLFIPCGTGLLRPDPEVLGRDSDRDACRAFDEALAGPNERHMKGKYEIINLVSHPTYWRRGHASNLVKWISQLADQEGMEIGVVAGEAVEFYEKLGFERAESVVIPRNEKYPQDEELWIATRAVGGRKEK